MYKCQFSFIIPVYNVAPYLCECLDSIVKQDFKEWEAILIDDGSTDGSSSICDDYAEKDARFKVYHQLNSGVSVARNVGIENAHGEWIWFVDSDDYILPGALSKLKEVITENDCDTIFFGLLDEIEGVLQPSNYHCNDPLNQEKSEFLSQVSSYYNPTILFTKRYITENNLRFPQGLKMAEDMELQYKYLFFAQKPIQIAEQLYVCRHRDGSAMRNAESHRNNLQGTFTVCENLAKFIQEKELRAEYWMIIRIRQLLKSGLQSAERLSRKELNGTRSRLKAIISKYAKIGYSNIADSTIKLAMANLRLYFCCLKIYYKIKGIR